MIEIGINSEILTQILDGSKTIEGRLAKGKFLTIRTGDLISIREDIYAEGAIVESRESAAKIKVTEIEKFDGFKEMLVATGFKKVIPSAHNLEEASDEYDRYYSSEDQKRYGVLGISFQILSS